MSELKLLRKALITSTALIGGSFLTPTNAQAAPCPVFITGATLAGLACEFDSTSSVTVDNGGEVGTITMNSYAPASSFILNNGTISNNFSSGILISSGSLTNGIINNGTINITSSNAIEIISNSIINGGIRNAGIITSDLEGLRIVGSSIINGGITNSGLINSDSANDVAVLLGFNSLVNGDIDNSGAIQATGVGNGLHINLSSTITGNILNSGLIRGGGSGLSISTSVINGGITNSGTITGEGDDGINIRNASTIGGSITNTGTISGDDAGIHINNSATIAGSVSNAGTITGGNTGIYVSSSAVIAGGISNSGTIQGGTFGIQIDAGSNVSEIDLLGSSSRIIGAIDAVNTDVNITSGAAFTSEGTMNVNAVNIASNSVFTMANAITVQNGVANAGTLAIGTTARTITGNYVQSVGGMFRIAMQNTGAYGQLAASGNVDLSQSGAIDVNVVSGFNIDIGDVFANVISGSSLTAPIGGFNVTDNSRLLNFTAANGGSGVNLTAVVGTSVSQSNTAVGNNGGAGAAQKLDELIASNSGGDWSNVIGALNILSSDQEVADATNQTVPTLTGATPTALIETMSSASRIVQARQEANSGLSAGEDFYTIRHFWLKPFGSWGNQGTHDGVVGYDSNAYGIIAGADKLITDQIRVGIGASYFNSDLKSNTDRNQVDIDSYLGMVYGSYRIDDRTEVNAQAEAGFSRSDSRRIIDFGGLNRIASGSYDGWSLHAGTGVGQVINAGSNTTITPQARLDYFVVTNESYDESGAGVLNLQVDSQTQDQLIPALEVKANHKFTATLSGAINAGLGYDLLADHNSVSASFAGGGGVFVTRGLEPSPWVARSGAGLTWKQSDGLDVTARYDRKDRGSEYDDQTLSLKLRMLF